MQETRNIITEETRRELFTAATMDELFKLMDADVRPNEVVTSRKELDSSEGRALYIRAILREIMAIPPGVLDRPVFTKLNRYVKPYRKFYSWKDPIPSSEMPEEQK